MTASLRAQLTTGVALLAASAVAVAPSLAPPPLAMPTATHSIELTAGVEPLLPLPKPDVFPTLFQEVQHGILPSLGVALPTPDIPAPAPTATNINQAIKNIYNAAEPWVRYGFELATYAAGWVPYVGWLAPQIIIFYNFGERIVRSITFNLDDWIFGPLPFGQGLGNVARDSWNALVQLGIDELHFWLPPLPPLPLASTVTKAAQDVSGVIPGKMRSSIAAAPTRKPTPTPVRTTSAGIPRTADDASGRVAATVATPSGTNVTDSVSLVSARDGKGAPADKPAHRPSQKRTRRGW